MNNMFSCSKFNQDISKWNVSNAKFMEDMFYGSAFNQNLSDWNVSKAFNIDYIFSHSKMKVTPYWAKIDNFIDRKNAVEASLSKQILEDIIKSEKNKSNLHKI